MMLTDTFLFGKISIVTLCLSLSETTCLALNSNVSLSFFEVYLLK